MVKALSSFIILCACYFSASGQTFVKRDSVRMHTEIELQEAKAFRIKKSDTDSVFTFKVLPHDIVRNGNRTEMIMKFNQKNGYTYKYTWDFLLSGKYQQSNIEKYHVIIAQWWNGPAKGQKKDDIKGKQGPPLHFTVVKRGLYLYLQVFYGLQGKNKKKICQFQIYADKWYHVNADVRWSMYNDGYAKIRIGNISCSAKGPNKYNEVSNDFKLGAYRNINNLDTTMVLIKNVRILKE